MVKKCPQCFFRYHDMCDEYMGKCPRCERIKEDQWYGDGELTPKERKALKGPVVASQCRKVRTYRRPDCSHTWKC